jgi:hypothetical protein
MADITKMGIHYDIMMYVDRIMSAGVEGPYRISRTDFDPNHTKPLKTI